MAGFDEMLGMSQQPIQQTAPQPQQQAGYAAVTQPMDPTVQQINTPAANPAEVQQRASMWEQVAQRFQTDPSLRQAFMMMGAHLAQPNQPGQTTMGHAAQSLALGSQVYNAGEYTKYEQQRQAAEDARKQAESTSQIALQGAQTQGAIASAEGTRASTANTKAGTPGVAADAAVKVGTVDARTQAAQADAQKAATEAAQSKLALESATDQASVDKIVRENAKRAERIKAGIPDAALQKSALAAVEAAGLAADEAKARIAASKAATGASSAAAAHANAQTAREVETNKAFSELSKSDQLDFIKGTGKWSQSQSALRTQADVYGKLWDQFKDGHPAKAKGRAEWVAEQMSSAKSQDAVKQLTDYLKADGQDPEIIQGLTEIVKGNIATKKGAQTPAPGPGTRPPLGSFVKP